MTRLRTLDAVRGFAVMGILLLNIVDFAMPSYAYVDPYFYGGAEGANWWAWAITYVIADGKMRGLFTMLFGASTLLIAERALAGGESPAKVHYARMLSLFAIGMVHAYLIWAGDILVGYAICGGLVFAAWRLPTRHLLAIAAILLLAKIALGFSAYGYARQFEARATAPGATIALRREWATFRESMGASNAEIPRELAAYRGGWTAVQPMRADTARYMQTNIFLDMLPDTIALMLIGMAMFRSGFFSGAWSQRRYALVMVAGYAIAVPLYLPLVAWIDATHFDPVTLMLTEPVHLVVLRPPLALAHAAAVILFVRSGALPWLADRLAATGRMAFSNYLLTSIVCTLIFYGYGLGWYGHLARWQLYPIVLGICGLMLLWSKAWLARFEHGPFEWLWRSLSRQRWQRFRR